MHTDKVKGLYCTEPWHSTHVEFDWIGASSPADPLASSCSRRSASSAPLLLDDGEGAQGLPGEGIGCSKGCNRLSLRFMANWLYLLPIFGHYKVSFWHCRREDAMHEQNGSGCLNEVFNRGCAKHDVRTFVKGRTPPALLPCTLQLFAR